MNAMIPFAAGGAPAHISNAFAGLGSNIPERQSVPSLSYEGKTWTIHKEGAKQKLMTRDADGEQIPLSIMKVVILDSAPRRGRAFYEGTYDPNKIAAPACWSHDGERPDQSITNPCAASCAACPNSVKGSKVLDNGNTTTACSQHRMLAVIPSGDLNYTPLRLKIAITSDWDNNSPEMEREGWFSYSKYLDYLKANGCPHTAAVVTKIRFDANAAYPKLFFAAERWLSEEEQYTVAPRVKTPEVQKLIDGSWTPAGVDGVPTQNAQAAAQINPAPAPVQPVEEKVQIAPAPAPAPAPVQEAVMIMDDSEPAPVTKPAKAKAKEAEPAPAPEQAPAASTDVPSEIASLLDAWG